jgi:1-acyl-sn-glycerol-3-phosphate acyltransferase
MQILFRVIYRIKVTGAENIPQSGGVIICANHSHGFDPIVVALAFKRRLRFIAKKELFKSKPRAWLLRALGAFPVDRSAADITAYKTAIKLLRNGEALLLFSQGTRKKTIDITDNKSGVAFFGIKAQAPIVPVGITTTYRAFSSVGIHIGKPINLEKYSGAKLKTELLNEVTEETVRQIIKLTGEK